MVHEPLRLGIQILLAEMRMNEVFFLRRERLEFALAQRTQTIRNDDFTFSKISCRKDSPPVQIAFTDTNIIHDKNASSMVKL